MRNIIEKDSEKNVRTIFRRSGFTLIEMIVIIAIIGILAMITLPKLANSIRAANEGATKGKLASIRSALSVYYSDHEGAYPSSLEPLMQPGSKYLSGAVPLYTSRHGTNYTVAYSSQADGSADTGTWGYVNSGSLWGKVWVQCTHANSGKSWSEY